MKSCMINGDMTSDKTDEQYPIVNFCDECYAELTKIGDVIVKEVPFDLDYGENCNRSECGRSLLFS